MHDVPLTSPAFAVKGLQGGHAMHIVPISIHDASYQTFKGMDLRFAATDTGVRHGALLHRGDTCQQRFYTNNTLYKLKIVYFYQLYKPFLRRSFCLTPAAARLCLKTYGEEQHHHY
jgi:hypothetical protein